MEKRGVGVPCFDEPLHIVRWKVESVVQFEGAGGTRSANNITV